MEKFKYHENDKFSFKLNSGDFCTILGKANKRIINHLYYLDKNNYVKINHLNFKNIDKKKIGSRINFVLYETADIFVCSKVKDEFNFVLENKGLTPLKITEEIAFYAYEFNVKDILDCDPNSLSLSKQIIIKFIIALMCEPTVLVINNILEVLDLKDRKVIIKSLKEYVKKGNVVINFTSNIEEAIIGNKTILTTENMIAIEGKTLSVLNEEKLLKRLGFSQPFTLMLCKLLMDYNLIDKYYLSNKKLVEKIWE